MKRKTSKTKTKKRPGGQRGGGRRAMFPSAGRQVSLHCRVPRPMLEALEAHGRDTNKSTGHHVRLALASYLEQLAASSEVAP